MADASPAPESRSPLERLLADVQSPNLRKAAGLEKKEEALFGDFKLIKKLGSGGMGSVWEAEQQSIQRRVALKILDHEDGISQRAMERFQREAEAGARLDHAAIATVYELGEVDGTPFIAQELVESGRTLEDLYLELSGQGELPDSHFRHMAELFIELAEAFQAAHDAGVIHRDIKPQNLLLTPNGEPRIVDFGLANLTDAQDLARTGDFLGTPYYMSPEQAASKRMGIDHRTDVFSLGATFYEALTLTRPFPGDSYPQVIKKVLLEEPINPTEIRSRVPRELATICLKALEKNADRRYPTMRDFAEDLRRFLEDLPILAAPPGPFRRTQKWLRRNPIFAAAGSIAMVTLVAATWLWMDSSHRIAKAEDGRLAANRATAQAQREKRVAEKAVDLVVDAFETLDPGRALGKNITVGMLVEQSLRLLEQDGQLDPASRARVRDALVQISPQENK